MYGNGLLKRLFSAGDGGIAVAAQEAFAIEPGYLTHREANAIIAELVEKDREGQLIPPVVTHSACRQRIYVALATIFPEVQRGTVVSCAGLCYMQILNASGLERRVRVAALPSHLESASHRKIQTLSLREEQLRQMLPWDRTLQRLEICCVREVLQTYVYQLSCIEIFAHPYEPGDDSLLVQEPVRAPDVQRERSEVVWTALPEMFVSATTAQDLAGCIKGSTQHGGKKTYPQPLFWLKTMVAVLNRQLRHLNAQSQAAICDRYTKLLAVAERMVSIFKRRNGSSHRCFLVDAIPLRRDGRCLGWHLVIALSKNALRQWG